MSERDLTILHESDVREVIQDEIETTVGIDNSSISDASTSHALNATYSHTEVEGALNTLGTKLNLVLSALRINGIIEEEAGK